MLFAGITTEAITMKAVTERNDQILVICRHISQRSGLSFKENNMHLLQTAIEKRMASLEMDDINKYYLYLKSHEEGNNELQNLYNLITVNETEFFRDRKRMRALFEKVIPEIVSDKISSSSINEALPLVSIWSAGCSSGEEPYSIAIGRQESKAYRPWYDIELLATDISSDILSSARASIYDPRKLKNADESVKERYFVKTDGGFQLKDNVKNAVNFRYHNLIEDPVPESTKKLWDVIICQNVIIYFDRETIKKVIDKFYSSLEVGGYLILGFSENLLGISSLFSTEYFENTAIYRKLPEKITVLPDYQYRDSVGECILTEISEVDQKAFGYLEAVKHFSNDDFDKAQDLLMKQIQVHQNDEKSQNLLGQVFLEKKLYREAELQFKACLAINAFEPSLYYYLGLVYHRMDQPYDVIRFLKKAIYLDKENVLAHLHLADAYFMTNDKQNAMREYRNTLRYLKNNTSESTFPFSRGLTCSNIIDICTTRLKELENEILPKRIGQYQEFLKHTEMG